MTDTAKKLSALAVVSCILGVAGIAMLTPLGSFAHHGVEESFLNCLVLPTAAVILGLVALRRTRRDSERKGRGFAFAGLLLGAGVVALLLAVAGLRIRAVTHFRICGDNLQEIEHAAQRAGQDQRYYDEPQKQMKMLLEQLPNGRLPDCPGGGQYTVRTPSGEGQCSKHGDPATCRMGI